MKLPSHLIAGQGPDLVLMLHGIGGGQAIWGDEGSGTLQALAELGCRAVALDLPGYGHSVALGPPTLASMVDAAQALIQLLAPRRLALLGHSMGGMVAQELLATRPQTPVQALVLACTSSGFGRPGGDWQAAFVAERLAPLDAGLGMVAMAEQVVPGMVSSQAVAEAQARAIAVMARVPEPTYRSALQAIVSFDRRAELAALRMPVLCLAGEHDRTAPPELMQRMAGRLPQGEFQCLSGAGHIANLEQPVAFNAAVTAFLQRQHFGR